MDGDGRQVEVSHLESVPQTISFWECSGDLSRFQLSPRIFTRYSPPMSRNVVAHGTPDRSFAGLMDHLAGFSRKDASGFDSDSDFGAIFRRTSKPDSEVIDGALTNRRSGARPMLPVMERKPGRAAPLTDTTALSYEKALQIHGRRRGPQSAPAVRTAPAAQSQQAAAPTREDAAVGARKAAPKAKAVAQAAKLQASPSKTNASTVRNGAKLNPRNARSASPPVASPVQGAPVSRQAKRTLDLAAQANPGPGVRSGSPQLAATSTRGKKAATAESSVPKAAAKAVRGVAAEVAEVRDGPKLRRKGKSGGKVHREGLNDNASFVFRTEPSQNPVADQGTFRRQIHSLESAVDAIPASPPGSQLELLQAFGQLDQRRTIVSVRLTEGEFACLRDRAEESGISVSAYMRSCVVDADQLRAQVKRALMEMRSLSAAAGTEPGTALTASRHKTGDSSGWSTHGWFRLVLRPLALLFGPLFPARRSA